MPHTRPIFTPPVVLRWGFILLGITAVSLILIIASGQLDPQPIGTATASLTPGVQPIPTQSKTAQWLTLPDPGHVFTVRGTAVFTETADIRGGLRLGTSAQAFDVLISPSGYAAIRTGADELFPYQPWPHVRADENEIWVDVQEQVITVRINREWLWSGTVTFPLSQIGLVAESFVTTPTSIDWQTVTLYQPTAQN
ncbi:MAG: hypothetical protein H6660_08090 [Ardenticatenaceae bacterium]|nr:hypothetical protein [Ardenticatenaceae bacterium]